MAETRQSITAVIGCFGRRFRTSTRMFHWISKMQRRTATLPFLDKARLRPAATGLAQNPGAPLRVIRKIMTVPGLATVMAVRRGRIPDDLAEALLELKDRHVAFLLDAENRTSDAFRERLAQHPDPEMRDATPRYARLWVENDVWVPLAMLRRLTETTGPDALIELARDGDPRVRRAVARAWTDAPAHVRRAFLTDPDPRVRAIASHSGVQAPPDLHQQLLADPATRVAVAAYAAVSPQLAIKLADDDDENVRIAIAENPHLPDAVRERLAASNQPIIWANLIRNAATPDTLRTRLHDGLVALTREQENAPSADIVYAWASLLHEPLPWLEALPWPKRAAYLDSPLVVFRHAIAGHDDLPPDAVAKLHRDPDPDVRCRIAQRPDTPGDIVERVVRECGESPKLRPLLVDHPNFPRANFATYAEHAEPRLRALACRDPALAADVVGRLSRDETAPVRKSAAGHPNIRLDDLMRLFADDDLTVVEAAAASPALPLAAMDHIAACVAGPWALRAWARAKHWIGATAASIGGADRAAVRND